MPGAGYRRKGHAFCVYCKRGPLVPLARHARPTKLSWTDDHINPRRNGGGKWYPCCYQCNQLKGSIDPHDWFWFIDTFDRWWRSFATTQDVQAVIHQERMRRIYAREESMLMRWERIRAERRVARLARIASETERHTNERHGQAEGVGRG